MIETIFKKLNSIPADKVLHFASGVILYALAAHLLVPLEALILVGIIGFSKEAYDYFTGRGTPEFYDGVATLLGAGVGFWIEVWA